MISLIIPIYNVEKFLDRSLKSVEDQTIDKNEFEVILVNDGSTDGSKEIIAKYMKRNPNFKYLEKKNGGLSDARNYGLDHAKGEYVAFLDSDDYVEPETYQLLYNKAKEGDYDLVECDFAWEYEDEGWVKADFRKAYGYSDKHDMLKNIRVVAWNKLIKKSLIDKLNLRFSYGLRYEDIDFTYKLVPYLEADKVEYVDRVLIHYVQRSTSIAKVQNSKTGDIFTILDNFINYYKENNFYDEYKDEIEYTYVRTLLCSSLKRMAKVQDKNIRKELLKKTKDEIKKNFPNYKKNKYIKYPDSRKDKYLKRMNPIKFKIYTILLRHFDLNF
jgi:hypothetical protein